MISLLSASDTRPVLPERRYPILVIGAGGIARDAHLPAYRMAEFPVWGLCDRSREHAESLAHEFSVPHAFSNLDEALVQAPPGYPF